MKVIRYIIAALIIILIIKTYPWIISAGGPGNISYYYISCNKATFEMKIDSLVKYSGLVFIPTNPNHNLAGTGYEVDNKTIAMQSGNSTYVFRYSYVNRENRLTDSIFTIALTKAGKFDEPLKIDRQLFPFEDCLWENRFEKLLRKCNLEFLKESN